MFIKHSQHSVQCVSIFLALLFQSVIGYSVSPIVLNMDEAEMYSNLQLVFPLEITWSHPDSMVVQVYKKQTLIYEHIHSSGDIIQTESGIIEIKLWLPGAATPYKSVWIEMLDKREPEMCASVTLVTPQGTHDRKDANHFPASGPIQLSWEPSKCAMTIQYYQRNELQATYPEISSGSIIDIGSPCSETEIKIWEPGSKQPSESIWFGNDIMPEFLSPQGVRHRSNVKLSLFSNIVEASWVPSTCGQMIIQYYQNDILKGEYKGIEPGDEIRLGVPGSGETEIKLWKPGAVAPSDSRWLWVIY